MKIIFLDYDGVVNTLWFQDINGEPNFNFPKLKQVNNTQAIAWLNKLVRETDAKIVVTSTWRTREDYKECLYNAGFKGEILGRTTLYHLENRGLEIQDWLNDHQELEIEEFIILDDDIDMAHLIKHLIKTDNILGFTYYEYEKAIEKLNKERK